MKKLMKAREKIKIVSCRERLSTSITEVESSFLHQANELSKKLGSSMRKAKRDRQTLYLRLKALGMACFRRWRVIEPKSDDVDERAISDFQTAALPNFHYAVCRVLRKRDSVSECTRCLNECASRREQSSMSNDTYAYNYSYQSTNSRLAVRFRMSVYVRLTTLANVQSVRNKSNGCARC